MSFIGKGEERMLGAVQGRVGWRARLHVLWRAVINPVVSWHRLNEHLLRDIGKSAADAEREAYIRSFGTFRRFRFPDRE
ncbi:MULTISPECIES: hypothetical protein [Rhizobium]|uniref:hypothetical protein n=1 Tax=Rhizobium TaxID=379 RepID=UPI0007EB994B|nr:MULTISPECIES: hypothetical protein [Rhizobium]ANK91284.1 hypothetical protein AMK01_CH01807 [Rhizobium sp. N6212]ANK97317.1 hypothetical protein AMK00_CH01809 [Rhizobium sp. N621]ANL03437.1 hypothetical protein AMJ99_CH01877 [Rhizobium esperanzae]ANL09482.1 hypothetical protein AMJ98_CH01798 [Rhizobium sp. N1341]ANL21530.1 hypothetical protein AMJ96_CH01801 [Rhizobium sp. N113]